MITDKGTGKRIKLSEFEVMSRARKGLLIVRDVKTNPYHIINTFVVSSKSTISLKLGNDYKEIKLTELPITDRYSTGTVITKGNIEKVFLNRVIVSKKDINLKEEEPKVEKLTLQQIDEKILTIDDFLDDFKFKD